MSRSEKLIKQLEEFQERDRAKISKLNKRTQLTATEIAFIKRLE